MKYFCITMMLLTLTCHSQVGIGTTNPQATLDIREDDPTNPTPYAGLAVPQVNVLPTSGNRLGQVIMLTTNSTFYYYNGTIWTPLTAKATVGDIKSGFQTTDHYGWIQLNGRALSSLNASQQANAAALGFTTSLPNASNLVLIQNGSTPGTIAGSMSKTLTQANLPNINFPTATSTTAGNHTHTHNAPGTSGNYGLVLRSQSNANVTVQHTDTNGAGNEPDLTATVSNLTINSGGNHTHNVTVSSGGSGTPVDITPKSLSVNIFVYLGE